jgi:hypothetical protein
VYNVSLWERLGCGDALFAYLVTVDEEFAGPETQTQIEEVAGADFVDIAGANSYSGILLNVIVTIIIIIVIIVIVIVIIVIIIIIIVIIFVIVIIINGSDYDYYTYCYCYCY